MEGFDYISSLREAEREYMNKTLLDRKQWYEEDKDTWDIDYANLGIHDSQAAAEIRQDILNKTITTSSTEKRDK